jgi:hypothetical protein
MAGVDQESADLVLSHSAGESSRISRVSVGIEPVEKMARLTVRHDQLAAGSR